MPVDKERIKRIASILKGKKDAGKLVKSVRKPLFDKKKVADRIPADGGYPNGTQGVVSAVRHYLFNDDNYVGDRIKRAMEDASRGELDPESLSQMLAHEDAKRIYLGMPQVYGSFEPSPYRPTVGTMENPYQLNGLLSDDSFENTVLPMYATWKTGQDWPLYDTASRVTDLGGSAQLSNFPYLHRAGMSEGYDDKGQYISLHDVWDYNTAVKGKDGDNIGKWVGGKPFDVYQRYYLDDWLDIPEEARGNPYIAPSYIESYIESDDTGSSLPRNFEFNGLPNERGEWAPPELFASGGKFIRAPKYNNGTARFIELLDDYASMLYNPYEPSVPEVRTPIRYEPQPHYGLYEYPASTGLVEAYPITVSGVVAAPVVASEPEEVVEDLFSEEAMARRALKQRYAESNFDNKAKSHAGAIGAWQIMPITYKDYLGRGRGKAGDLNDPEYNRKVRDWVMGIIPRDLQDLYSENDAPRVKLAKIYGAYNWGAGNMRKYLRKQRDAGVDISNDTSWVEGLNPETKRYIKYLALDEDIPDSTYTNRAFEEAAAKRGYMKDGGPLNLLYGGGDKFELGNLTGGLYPLESNAVAEDTVVPYTEEGIREKRFYDDPSNKKTHRVSAGETAWGISQQSGVPLQTLLKMNPDIGDGSLIKPGQELMLGYKPYPANREKDGDKVSASMLTYKVQKGDYLGKIAKDNGLTLEQLLKINPQFTGRENAIAIGETVNLGEAKQKREFKTMRERREWERGLDDVSAIQNYKHEKNYAIVDKERQTMTVYSPDNKIVRVIHVNTGSSNDDFNTRTYSNDKGHILYGQGNMSTPAGITEIVSIGKDYGHKSYVRARVGSDGKVSTVKDENGNTVADTIASSMHYEKGLFGPNSSNGCIRMSGEDADSLSDILGVGSRVYTLPQRKDENGDSLSRFKLEDGKLSFYSDDPVGRTDNNGLEPIPVYEKGRPKKDKNGNIIYRDFASEDDYNLTRDMTAAPLFSNYSGDSEAETELERNRAAFANTLADEKQSIMSDLIANKIGLNSDTYNRLAELSVALAAQESEFGTGKKFKVKAAFPGAVRALKGENGAQSVGATQMKYAGYNDEVRKIMRRMRINTSIDTDNQKDIENSARATIVLLAYMYNNQLTPSHRRKLKEAGMSEEEALAMMFNGRSVKELEELVSDKNWREKLITVSKYPGGIGRNLPFNLGTKEVLAADYANKVNKYLQENESFHYSFGGLLDKLGSVYRNDRARMLEAIRKIRMNRFDGNSKDTGQMRRAPFWQRMVQGATMAEAPAVMTAAGMEVNPDGTITYGNDSEGVRQLRDNLAVIGATGLGSFLGGSGLLYDIGKSAAVGIDTMGRMAMPSTFLKGVATYVPKAAGALEAASPWLDAGALSLWSAKAGQSAIDAGRHGDAGTATAMGTMALMPLIPIAPSLTNGTKDIRFGLSNLNEYRKLLKDPENYMSGLKYARDKYAARADVLDRNMKLAAGYTIDEANNPFLPRIIKERSVLDNLPEVSLTHPFTGWMKKYVGKTDQFTGSITLNPWHKKVIQEAWKNPRTALQIVDADAGAHEGTHWALKKLGANTLSRPGTIYYEANPNHPLFQEVTWQFSDPNRIIGAPTPFKEAWMRSPEEFVAEMTNKEYYHGIPFNQTYPQWDLMKADKINNFLGKRFSFPKEDAGEIARRFSLFGFKNGGKMKN